MQCKEEKAMREANPQTLSYRILRYTPNLIRDEWINVGVLLANPTEKRIEARLIAQDAEYARVRRLHPAADLDLLRAFGRQFESQLREANGGRGEFLVKVEQTFSNALQFSPPNGVEAEDFPSELERLYEAHVAPPAYSREGMVAKGRAWIRSRLRDIFRKSRILEKMEKSVRVEEFTEPGDPMRIDYAYRKNGTRGFLQTLSLERDLGQAKVLAYTAERIRAKLKSAEFAAITELEPAAENSEHQFVARLLAEQQIRVIPLSRAAGFADELRTRLN
jgi:hypothetical protein